MALTYDAQIMYWRLRQRLTPGELFALAFALGMVGIFTWLPPGAPFAFDFRIYLGTAQGNFSYYYYGQQYYYYYGYWLVPIFIGLAKLPLNLSYVLWCAINILAVFFAARVLGGNVPMAVLSYQMLYSLYYGQIDGIIVGGLALVWWGLVNQKWNIAGLGIALASAKYQLGFTGSLFLMLLADVSWKDRLRVLVVPILVVLASLILFPYWPLQVLNTLRTNPPNDEGSISLWRWLGPSVLLLWIPPLLLNLTRERRLLALVAVTGLTLPYFQQADLLFLLALPIGWIGLLGNLGYLLMVKGWVVLQALALMPLVVYVTILAPAFVRLMNCFVRRVLRRSDSEKKH
jgi:Glycosyltransferase family 87